MTKGWETKRLADILQKTDMVDPTKKPNWEFKYIDVSSVNNKTFQIESSSVIKGIDAPSRARKLVKTNDVIFAMVRPTLRRIAIIPKELNEQICSTGYFVLRPIPGINSKLLFYFLKTDSFISKMEKLQRGASYPAITEGDIKEQLFSYPQSELDQNRLVTILDKVFDAIDKVKENIEKNLKNTKELEKAILNKAFSGELTAATKTLLA